MRLSIIPISLLAATALWAADTPQFERDVKPLFSRYCLQCHGETVKMSDLDLRTPSVMLKGGAKGPAIEKGSAEKSLLFRRIADKSMPMGSKKLTDEEARTIKEWIDAGAPASEPDAQSAASRPATEHWSFRTPQRPAVPAVRDASWIRTPVDNFVLHQLEAKGIRPNPPADRTTLLRRAYFTIIGLPPTPDEVKTFLADHAPDAMDRVIEQLLARAQYGERWARHWLDVVRFAESNGYERDGTKPSAWRYRDYVIDSFNKNKPFDRFVTEQVAGDEIQGANAETQIATTFLRLGLWDDEPADPLLDRYDQLDDVLAGASSAFLGLTIRCARCHDHKFEPFSQKDYYKLLAVFEPLQRPLQGRTDLDVRVGTAEELAAYDLALKNAEAEIDPLQRLIENLKRGLLERFMARRKEIGPSISLQDPVDAVLAFRLPPNRRSKEQTQIVSEFENKLEREMLRLATPDEAAQYEAWIRRIAEIRAVRPADPPRAYIWQEEGSKAPVTRLFHRGNPAEPREEVAPGVPAVLGELPLDSLKPTAQSTGRRLWLARWMIKPDHPLVARVFVNRVWQWTFGEGLVASANDFGVMGQRPSNQDLLDFLASEFVRAGWNVKELQRLILRSSTFRLSSAWDERTAMLDADQSLVWRWRPRRLEAETLRDSTLAVSGRLNLQMHGRGIYPQVPRAVLAGQSRPGDGWGTSNEQQASRRSIYIFAKRGVAVPEMELLDTPDTTLSCEKRRVSTTGPQALTLLNGAFSQSQAGYFASRLVEDAGPDSNAQIRRAFELALNRAPGNDEIDQALSFLSRQAALIEADGKAAGKPVPDAKFRALRDFSLVLLNTNDFFYLN